MSRLRSTLSELAYLTALSLLPLLAVAGKHDAFLGHSESELPVKIWVHEIFSQVGIFGGVVEATGFPHPGPLNNPDPFGTTLTLLTGSLLGSAGAYNLVIILQIWLAMVSIWLLGRQLLGDGRAALTAAVAFGFAPLLLTYGVASAVIDILNVWPYPLALFLLLRSFEKTDVRLALAAGLVGGIGFVTCPYNAVLFVVGFVPVALWALVNRRRILGEGFLKSLVVAGLSAGIVAGLYGLWMRGLMVNSASQMSAELVDSTRHRWPYPYLMPGNDRYVSALTDYLLTGKNSLILRSVGSRFFRSVGPGYGVIILMILTIGLRHRRQSDMLPWWGMAGVSVLASTGPYLVMSPTVSLPIPANPFWLLPHWLIPGANQLLEPFRYGLPAAMGFAMLAAGGSGALMAHLGRWVGWVTPLVLVTGLLAVEPVPTPLPVATFGQEPTLQQIASQLPEGALIRLPFYDGGTARFTRRHFYEQLRHGRPIADQAAGFPTDYMLQNRLIAMLLQAEHSDGFKTLMDHYPEGSRPVVTGTREDRWRARNQLVADGFVAIIVNMDGYANARSVAEVTSMLKEIGEPVENGRFTVWKLK